MKDTLRFAFCFALPLLGLSACRETREYVAVNATAAAAVRGAQLFAQHCAVCHGDDGRGDGAARPYLYPPARNFGLGSFRLSTTDNGVSSDEDLLATLSRGMPGSAMPAWSWMREEDLRALVLHVRTLARDGLVARARSAALQDGETFDRAATTARVERSLRPGRSIPRPSPADYASASPERGKLLYEQNCANCHGADGKGNRKQVAWNNDGSINWARDFTSGFLKGGSSREALAARIQVGLPGSAMPAHGNFSPADVAALTLHLEKLIPPQSDRWLVHRQERVVAHRLIGSVPSDPLDVLLSQRLVCASKVDHGHFCVHNDNVIGAVQRQPSPTRSRHVLNRWRVCRGGHDHV